MSKLVLNLLYGSVCLFLMLVCSVSLAADVYVTTDKHGRLQYSDSKPDKPHKLQRIDIENDYPWAEAPAFRYSKKPRRKKKRIRKQKRYTLTELKTRCHAARGRYNNFRGTNKNIDWDTYRARLEKYKARRDKWCSRLLKGH